MQIVDIYKALADESRLRILNILSNGYFNVQELTSVLSLGQSTISHHLKTLQGNGLVKSHREGTWIYYSLNNGDTPGSAQQILRSFLDIVSAGELDSSLTGIIQQDGKAIAQILARRRDHSHDFFQANAGKWTQISTGMPGGDSYMNAVAKIIPEEATLLELGCGSGALLEKILPRSGKTIGVDYSQAMLDEARQRLTKAGHSPDLRLGHLEHLPLGDNSADMAVACMVMHHIAQPSAALKEIFRVLKPGGELLIVDLYSHDKEYMRERMADLWLGFDVREFKSWLAKAGFRNNKSESLGEKKEIFILKSLKL